MLGFINDHREMCGVESICRVVPIAPSTYYRHRARQLDPTKRSARAIHDDVVNAVMQRIWGEQDQAYGSRKMWKQMGREGLHEARCRVRRLMRELGLVGVVRGRAWTTTTQLDAAAARPADLVDGRFVPTRPNQLWVAFKSNNLREGVTRHVVVFDDQYQPERVTRRSGRKELSPSGNRHQSRTD